MIQLIVDGEIVNPYFKDSKVLDYVPAVDSTIIYKTFRSNKSMREPIYDIVYKVTHIEYETEESWNGRYDNKIVKVYAIQLFKTEIK